MTGMGDDPPLDSFLTTLRRSRLLDAGELDRFIGRLRPASARAFADATSGPTTSHTTRPTSSSAGAGRGWFSARTACSRPSAAAAWAPSCTSPATGG